MLHWWRVNGSGTVSKVSLQPPTNAEHEPGQTACNDFQDIGITIDSPPMQHSPRRAKPPRGDGTGTDV